MWRILSLIQAHFDGYQTYVSQFIAPNKRKNQSSTIFKYAENIDLMFFKDDQLAYDDAWKAMGAPASVDEKALFERTSLIWCHDYLTQPKFEYFASKLTHLIYIHRDIESVLKSFAVHSIRYQHLNPAYTLNDPQSVLDNKKFVINNTKRWLQHLSGFLQNRQKMHFVDYKHLVTQKESVCRGLIALMVADANSNDVDSLVAKIMSETSIDNMQKESAEHVNTLSSQLTISASHKEMIQDLTKDAKIQLAGYGYKIAV